MPRKDWKNLQPETLVLERLPRGTVTGPDQQILMWTLEQAAKARIPAEEIPTFVEIGTHRAVTAKALTLALADLRLRSRLRTIDIDFLNTNPRGEDGFYPRDAYAAMIRTLEGNKGIGLGVERDVEFIEKPAVEAAAEVPDPVVWVFCDGCHCEECVRGETEAYAPRIVPGGWLLYHDCGPQYRDYPPDQKYHGDASRAFHVIEYVETSDILERDFSLIVATPPARRGSKWFGGIYAYQKKGA